MSSPVLDSREPELSAPDILARLERYAAAYRASGRGPSPRLAVSGTASITLATLAPPVRVFETPAASLAPPTDDFHPHALRRGRVDPATADLFPYDLAATIVGCIATVLANIVLAGPFALAITVGLLAAGEGSRRRRWFPSAGVNFMIGVVAGAVLVLIA